jgi:hypothetical protein
VFDSAYRHGRIVADTPTVSRYTPEEKEAINDEIDRLDMERDVRDNALAQEEIARELAKPWLNDFPSRCIPHDNDQMFDLESQRNSVEHDLDCLNAHVAIDGTPLDPAIDRDDLFHALNVRYSNLNRAMYTVFANVLQNEALSATARLSRKRRASAEPQPPTPPESIEDEPDPCPYLHIKDEPAADKTVPSFDPLPKTNPSRDNTEPETDPSRDHACYTRTIQIPSSFASWIGPVTPFSDSTTCALQLGAVTQSIHQANLALQPKTGSRPANAILAVPDSGASHILIRQSDAHILHDVLFTKPRQAPYAVLKAANNSELIAIGRRTLNIAGLRPPAYIFRDGDLAADLLGLAPFCDLGCTAVFGKHTFHLLQHKQSAPLMIGARKTNQALWHIAIPTAVSSDHTTIFSDQWERCVYRGQFRFGT